MSEERETGDEPELPPEQPPPFLIPGGTPVVPPPIVPPDVEEPEKEK